jgi:hypothetical protein
MLSESLPTESLVDAWPMLEIDACEDTGGQYNFAIEFLRPKDPLSRKVLSACTLKKEAVDNPVLGKKHASDNKKLRTEWQQAVGTANFKHTIHNGSTTLRQQTHAETIDMEARSAECYLSRL